MGNSDYQLITLNNGLRVAHLKVSSTLLVHCGFVINSGSRDDGPIEGIAHFLEHMLFKGTQRRKTVHVLNHLENVGGELNAFTTKEPTSVYATVQKKHFQRAVDILVDITFRSSFPDSEIQKEKTVIKDEINMYLDNPDENIYDEFQEMVFENHPLAHNILGTEKSISQINSQHLKQFIENNYTSDNIVFVVVGNVSINRTVEALNKFMDDINLSSLSKSHNYQPIKYLPKKVEKPSDFGQSYGIMGIPCYTDTHEMRYPMILLNNLLGGPGMNSRLNLGIREKYGFTYHIESGYSAFSDTGLFHCYLSCEEQYLKRSFELIRKELQKLKNKKLGRLQLQQAKNQISGNLIISSESRTGLLLHIGKGIVKYGRANSIIETISKIENVSADQVLEAANEIFNFEEFSELIYYPE